MLRLFNTLTRTAEDFQPLHPPFVTYYSCGPTVYDYAHIGHARTFVFADILQRVLELNTYQVKRVMNITDVGHLVSDSDEGEDKMEKGAVREQKSVWEIAKYYTNDFFQMLEALNIPIPALLPRATVYIPQMIALITVLEQKGYTYTITDGVYFDTSKVADYGKLTGHSLVELTQRIKAGARVEMVAGKKHPTDFALWKFSAVVKQRQMEWDSPLGKGFPGWHIECSAMSMDLLGETIDVHTGGVDHIPIHHTNEIAQSEAATGKQFVRTWVHGEHLLIDGQKMSKSLGNFYRLKDVEEKGYSPVALRYLFLTASYRKQMNFTWASVAAAHTAWTGLRQQVQQLQDVARSDEYSSAYTAKMLRALNDDLNTAQAIAMLWEALKSNLTAPEKLAVVDFADAVLGLSLLSVADGKSQVIIPEELQQLLREREALRKQKQWQEADLVRGKIEERGYVIEDTPQGARLKKK